MPKPQRFCFPRRNPQWSLRAGELSNTPSVPRCSWNGRSRYAAEPVRCGDLDPSCRSSQLLRRIPNYKSSWRHSPPGEGRWRERESGSVAGLQALHQLSHKGDIPVRIERIGGEAIGVVPCKHQLALDIVGMPDRLEGLLDTKAARIGLLA